MKTILLLMAWVLPLWAAAEVTSVFIWKSPPGYQAGMFDTADKARAIHEEMGARVSVGADQFDRLHYVVTFEDAVARGAFLDGVAQNEAFAALMADASQRRGSASLEEVLTLRTVAPGNISEGTSLVVYRWQPQPGRGQEFVEIARRAKAIHEKLGAKVSVAVDDRGHVHYAESFANWESQGKFEEALQKNEEWARFMEEASREPIATLVDVNRISWM